MEKLKNNSLQFAYYFLLAVGATLYLLQAFTPFRLTSDSIYYLTMADAAATGHGFVGHNQPIGYPLFIFLLIKAGIFSSATMGLANCLFFAIGLVLSFRTLLTLGYSRILSLVACLVALFSFTAVKHVTQGMSDFLFFALSASVCWTITLKTHWKWITLPILVLCAVEVRFMGLALAFPVAVTVWPYVKKYRAGLIVAVFVLLGTFAVGLWVGRQYFLDNLELLHRFGISHFVLRALVLHAQDFGEFVFNVPLTKLPRLRIPLMLIGACTMFLFFYGILTTWRRSQWLSSYLAASCLLVLPWPYTDPRFWLHLMPFLVVVLVTVVRSFAEKMKLRAAAFKAPALVYVGLFCCLGFVALGYSSWITFSGPQFAYRYGDGLLRPSYLAGCSSSTGNQHIDPLALRLLRAYEWHCAESPVTTVSTQ